MSVVHVVRVGLMATVGQYVSADSRLYRRDTPVIVRTERGLEHGVVVCPLEDRSIESAGLTSKPTRQILRRITPDDRRILDRLEKHRDKAFDACQKLLREREIPAILMDVEHLFDGQSVYFYFLGEVDPRLEALTEELAGTYEQKVRFRKFAQTLAEGCGPDCGTREGGCSSSGCSSCKLSSSCGSKV